MGEPLYEQVVGPVAEGRLGRPCRIYAPVGTHETLLAYLVRRLLENGANTSFVNRIADASIALEDLVQDPVRAVEQAAAAEGRAGLPHPRIPAPRDLYGADRTNSAGMDLSNELQLRTLCDALQASATHPWRAGPLLAGEAQPLGLRDVLNPADHRDAVGQVQDASAADVDAALQAATSFAPQWAATLPPERAAALERAADALQAHMPVLLGLLVREAGKTYANGIAEVREAVDFLRFYAAQARGFDAAAHRPLGPVVCISPWNFPLAIFTGQVAAALAAGNPVLAKPAEQTPLVAAEAVRVLHAAGVPRAALQLLPGDGARVGARLVGDARTLGVMFTGSTEVARLLQATLADRLDAQGRPIPLIAETGGQNAMIVDSSALVEQVVGDLVSSAFDSAGQRCSALRVLCVQDDVADRVIEMLKGAMAECRIGHPETLEVDIGPVIDAEARDGIERHVEALRAKGRRVHRDARGPEADRTHGTFVLPTLIELDNLGELGREVFGPVLHLVRFRRDGLDRLLDEINQTGYGLTMGVHTRIDETIARVLGRAQAGNLYVNRNMVGAVVGVQPFGGEGLSGTGPKAGGPLYLLRLLSQRPEGAALQAVCEVGEADLTPARETLLQPLRALQAWAAGQGLAALAATCTRFAAQSPAGLSRTLTGPTGERNVYTVHARERVLCLAGNDADRLVQLAATLAVGGTAVWPADAADLLERLPAEVQARLALAADWRQDTVAFDAVLHHGSTEALRAVCHAMARRPGPIVGVTGLAAGAAAVPLERLVIERALSVNTAAAGGNASLMTMG
jgi:RHH-type proline utilization regulon transcriptional repressor/proline dehydrogenase/delta 1-pyrroline-5-carboxylate dehydrogenase